MRSSNPTLRAFEAPQTWDDAHAGRPLSKAGTNTMTIGGTVTATSILLGICVAAAIGSWAAVSSANYAFLQFPFLLGGMIGGLVFGLIISFKPRTAQFLAPVYAALQGLFLGAFSYMVGNMVAAKVGASGSGTQIGTTLVLQAIGLTFAITAAMLFCYVSGIIKPGRVFRAVVVSAMGGLMLFFVVALVMSLFGNSTLISVYSPTNGGLISVGFSLLVIVIASLVLVLDFQWIDHGIQAGLPKHMEWYAGFALLVTLVWLYIEILRLLAKLRSNN
ncbi:hypothetical protein MNBD_PLANCTO03-2357 [hydrothermal vent metagenome]|uniref:Bax inhibitor-1/YccA family protein n=1 Tax=hydrothermal vent metagenome TaxID=652676 RepID=A0A3B1DTV1_9ZZZZ